MLDSFFCILHHLMHYLRNHSCYFIVTNFIVVVNVDNGDSYKLAQPSLSDVLV